MGGDWPGNPGCDDGVSGRHAGGLREDLHELNSLLKLKTEPGPSDCPGGPLLSQALRIRHRRDVTHSRWYAPDDMTTLDICLPSLLAFERKSQRFGQNPDAARIHVESPDGQLVFILCRTRRNSRMRRSRKRNGPSLFRDFRGKWLIDESVLGLKLQGAAGDRTRDAQGRVCTQASTMRRTRFRWARRARCGITTTRQRWTLTDASGRKLSIEVRAYDDGVAFRYIVPAQASLKDSAHRARADGVQLRRKMRRFIR